MSESAGTWYELSTTADAEAIEAVAELFARYGYNEGVAIEEPFLQEQDGDNLRVDPSRPATIRTYLPSENYDERVVQEIRRGLWHLGQMRQVGDLSVTERSEEDWANAWKEHYRPLRASNRVVIRPPWYQFDPGPDDIVLVLDPGMAFGTGTHPTTRLSLFQIEKHVQPGMSLFDVGTGSGVLALAAARLGAAPVDAVDIEPMSVRVAKANLALNEAEKHVSVEVGSADRAIQLGKRYDIVVANIIARVLITIADDLMNAVKPGGLLLLSGIIEPRADEARSAFSGFALVEENQIEDWISLTYRAPT